MEDENKNLNTRNDDENLKTKIQSNDNDENNNINTRQNSNLAMKTNREEGELSTSASLSSSSDDGNKDDNNNRNDDENIPVSSGTQLAVSANLPVSTIQLQQSRVVPPVFNKSTTETVAPAGKGISGKNPVNSGNAQFRPPLKPSNSNSNNKSFDKSRVPLKPVSPVWPGPPGGNSSLVISFSDDDTDSEREDGRPRKGLEFRRNVAGVGDGNQRPPTVLPAKSSKAQLTARNGSRVMPKKSLSRTFVSAITNINGGIHSKGAGSSSLDQVSRVKNYNTINRNLSNQETGSDQGLGSKTTELRDLRQQIALRERELKLKVGHTNKESASVRDYNSVNLAVDAARKSNLTSVGVRKLEGKQPDAKRLKVTGSHTSTIASDQQQETLPSKSNIPPKEQALGANSLKDRNLTDQGLRGSSAKRIDSYKISTKRMESTNVKWTKQDENCVNISENLPSGFKEGPNVNISRIQPDSSSMQVDLCLSLDQTAPVNNINLNVMPKNASCDNLNHPTMSGGYQPPGSLSKTTSGEQHIMHGAGYRDGISNDRGVDQALPKIYQASLDNGSPWNYFDPPKVSEHNNIDMNTLVELEESLDKELEEAQEQRRMCEIEERNALKAYRKAQRALVEANARCSELYRKREMYSAHFRSLFLNDSSLLWSSRKHEHGGTAFNHRNNTCRNLELIQPPPDYGGHDEPGYDSNIQCVIEAPSSTPYRDVNGQNLGSEPCSEPDASTSAPLPPNRKTNANATSSPSNDPVCSGDEDEETSPLDHEAVQPNYKNQQREQTSVEMQIESTKESNKELAVDCSPDSLTLEAALRSELFARLGRRVLSKGSGSFNLDPAVEPGSENDNGSERTQTSKGSVFLSEAQRCQEYDFGGNDRPERNASRAPPNIQNHKKDGEDSFSSTSHLSETSVFSPTSVLRSAFGHMKDIPALNLVGLQSQESKQDGTSDYSKQSAITVANPMEVGTVDLCGDEIGSFTCDLLVDPFWPLCMYELRGKCNNDQCPWQHVRDISKGNLGRHHDDFDSTDCQAGLTSHQNDSNGTTKLANFQRVLAPPTYLVGLDILKYDPPHSYATVVTRGSGKCWQKSFSICIALSNLFQKDLPAEESLLHGNDGRIEVQGNWNKQFLYLQSRKSLMNHQNQMLASTLQSLEMVFHILNQEANRLDCTKKTLSVLSRAIEADTHSEILWITYLLIYYGNGKPVAKDDMFFYAVKHNDRCYGLWLMYIHSRMYLDDRLVAYDFALQSLCHKSSGYGRDEMYASACILDIFLQKMDFLCMTGNVEKAIQKISELFLEEPSSDHDHSSVFSDILACLSISDKCVFWVCCVYLVMYRKLPEAVIHKLECHKELCTIDWPDVHLLDGEKQRAIKLVEMAVDSVKMCAGSGSLLSEVEHRSVQFFYLCHIRCMAILDGLECRQSLLDEYMKLYPSCLEFVLLSARFQMIDFEGFEEALKNWPTEGPGIHCIWNQYIDFALQKRGPEFAKELAIRWFNSYSGDKYSQEKNLDSEVAIINTSYEASVSNMNFLTTSSNDLNLMFGYLNLSIAKLLDNDLIEARKAVDSALKAAVPPFFEHCLREHAMFLLMHESQLEEGASTSKCLSVLNSYLGEAQAFPICEPLSRRFLDKIEKPRVKQLVNNILTPVSSNFSIVNLVLEVWYGSSLLPKKFAQPKELVDFVEAIMEIVPSNYPLAISACKLLSKDEKFMDVTSESMLYWASSTLVDSIFHAMPIAPECVWVDAAAILNRITGIELIRDRFYRKALSAYPFSIKLWNCYHIMSKTKGDATAVLEAAREKGIELD